MALIEYKEGEHPGGFIGVRIVRTVGDDYRQKYYGFRKIKDESEREKLRNEAEVLEAKWSIEARKIAIERAVVGDHPNVRAIHGTGYIGLRSVILCEKKQRAGELRHYYAPAFIAKGVRDKHFRIAQYGYEQAWKKAVEYYADNRELPRGLKPKIMEAIPEKGRFRKIRSNMKKFGHNIPLEVLKKLDL